MPANTIAPDVGTAGVNPVVLAEKLDTIPGTADGFAHVATPTAVVSIWPFTPGVIDAAETVPENTLVVPSS